MIRLFSAVCFAVLATAAGVAVAGNLSSNREIDYYAAGQHRFYVWCPGRTDYLVTQKGNSAEDAQMTLYTATKAVNKTSCWPVWQGRVAG
jgi:hypothetical protein